MQEQPAPQDNASKKTGDHGCQATGSWHCVWHTPEALPVRRLNETFPFLIYGHAALKVTDVFSAVVKAAYVQMCKHITASLH